MNATAILMIRHTDVHNPKDVIYGRLPRYRLSPTGIEQAQATARALADLTIARLYSSPQLRARQTARFLADATGAPISLQSGLAEMMTSWQGTPWTELGKDPDLYGLRREPTDEDIPDIYARMARVLMRLRRRHVGETVICISHADPIMILRVGHLGQELIPQNIRGEFYPQKGSITRFEFAPGSDIATVTYDDVNKLAPKPEEKPADTSDEQREPETATVS